MRVRVDYSIDAGDWYRRAIRHHYGKDGLATREETRRWLERYGSSGDDDLSHDLQMAIEHGDVEPVAPWRRRG